MNHNVIGEYTPKTKTIKREYFQQGWIYKNKNAYELADNQVCYIPELTDSTYTKKDFIAIAKGNERLAEVIFDTCDWQHPESLLEDWFTLGIIWECCGTYHFDDEPCSCGKRIEEVA